MDELIRRAVGDEPAWVVGGALRDELLGKDVVDVDVACSDPELAARLYSRLAGGAVFPLSERHGAWRVAFRNGTTVDFTPVHGETIEEDLRTRDFTVNAMARPLEGGPLVDPPGFLLVVVLGEGLRRFPISNDLRRLARTLLAAGRPPDDSPRAVHRFRRQTEPWALTALAYLGATDLYEAVRAARAADPPEPLLRGEDLLEVGVPAGPEVGR